MVMIGVTGPEGFRAAGTGSIYVRDAMPGLYRVRVYTPEGAAEEQAFLTVDGQIGGPLEAGDAVECEISDFDVLQTGTI